MTIALRYAARSDVGLLREGNEDSAYAGPHLLAVADGMGGHAHGEVASAVAISALTGLDEDLPGMDLLDALAEAVQTANDTLQEMVAADSSLEGMGTTLTAMLWSGARVAVCHIGDSRAYLLREGELYQITHDHTLVQSLVDEGRISPDEAATHPQRSLLLRALDGRGEVEPDLSLREAQVGDRYLLCSDGLSGVVSAETLHQALTGLREPDQVVIQLVELANRGGGPDNITCIVADTIDSATAPVPPTEVSVLAGAASNGRGRPAGIPDTPAGRATSLTQTAPQPVIPAQDAALDGRRAREPRRRRWPLVLTIFGILILIIVGGGYWGWHYSQGQYYVGTDGSQVVIYRGINQRVIGISLSSAYTHTGIAMADVPPEDRSAVRGNIPAGNLAKAQQIVNRLQLEVTNCKTAYHNQQVWIQQHPQQPQTSKHTATARPTSSPHTSQSPHASQSPHTSPPPVPTICPQATSTVDQSPTTTPKPAP